MTQEYRNRINEIAEGIKHEPEMRKMRDDISEGIKSTGNRQADVEDQFQQVIDETTGKDVISAPEIIAARNGEANLKQRLDKENQKVTAQLAQTEQELNSEIATIKDGGLNDNSIRGIKLRTTSNSDRLGLVNLKEEVIEAISGETAVNQIPADGSVTVEKFAPQLQSMFVEEGSGW